MLDHTEGTILFYLSEGRKHDAGMLRESGLVPMLQHNAISPTGQPLCVYGDPAYPLRVHLQAPFRQGVRFTPQMAAYNKSMSEVRVSVECLFWYIANYFKFVDFKKKIKNRAQWCWEIVRGVWSFKKYTYLSLWQSNLPVFWTGATSHSGLLCMKRTIKPWQSNFCAVTSFPTGQCKRVIKPSSYSL